jgi:hypothetical protein
MFWEFSDCDGFGLPFRPGGAFPSFVFLVPVCGKVRYRF